MHHGPFGADLLETIDAPVTAAGGHKWMDPRTGHIYYGDVLVE